MLSILVLQLVAKLLKFHTGTTNLCAHPFITVVTTDAPKAQIKTQMLH